MSDSVSPSQPQKKSHSLLETAVAVLQSREGTYYGLHFLGEETGSERLSGLPTLTQTVHNTVGMR